jgi:chorismate synthase
VEIRPLEDWDEYRSCEGLQREVWGAAFTELVPASLLKISQRVGGVTSGAFDEAGEMVGFVFGLTGLEGGRPVHWSHMLAVRDAYRGHGLGTALKRHQRERLAAQGVEVCYWTYDPLVSGNAHINLNRLLAVPVEYVVDMYGETGSYLHEGLGTDRFRVAWAVGPGAPDPFDPDEPARAEHRAELERHADAPVANPGGGTEEPFPDGLAVRVAVPSDIFAVRQSDPEEALRWRVSTRRALQHYMSAGYRVAGFRTPAAGSDVGHYVLVRAGSGA